METSVCISAQKRPRSLGTGDMTPPRGGPGLRKKVRFSHERKGVKKPKKVSFFRNMAHDAMGKN